MIAFVSSSLSISHSSFICSEEKDHSLHLFSRGKKKNYQAVKSTMRRNRIQSMISTSGENSWSFVSAFDPPVPLLMSGVVAIAKRN
jgi:hypothetical protein